jgi:hypothetical protein
LRRFSYCFTTRQTNNKKYLGERMGANTELTMRIIIILCGLMLFPLKSIAQVGELKGIWKLATPNGAFATFHESSAGFMMVLLDGPSWGAAAGVRKNNQAHVCTEVSSKNITKDKCYQIDITSTSSATLKVAVCDPIPVCTSSGGASFIIDRIF